MGISYSVIDGLVIWLQWRMGF